MRKAFDGFRHIGIKWRYHIVEEDVYMIKILVRIHVIFIRGLSIIS